MVPWNFSHPDPHHLSPHHFIHACLPATMPWRQRSKRNSGAGKAGKDGGEEAVASTQGGKGGVELLRCCTLGCSFWRNSSVGTVSAVVMPTINISLCPSLLTCHALLLHFSALHTYYHPNMLLEPSACIFGTYRTFFWNIPTIPPP